MLIVEVRIETIISMCSLATRHSEFAVVAMEFLVDMFNDEIEEVRLIAIESLVKLSYASGLRDDQVEIILAVIEVTFFFIKYKNKVHIIIILI